MSKKKNLNKIIVGAILGTAIGGLGLFSKTKKGKSFFGKLKSDISLGFKEMKRTFQQLISKKNDKK